MWCAKLSSAIASRVSASGTSASRLSRVQATQTPRERPPARPAPPALGNAAPRATDGVDDDAPKTDNDLISLGCTVAMLFVNDELAQPQVDNAQIQSFRVEFGAVVLLTKSVPGRAGHQRTFGLDSALLSSAADRHCVSVSITELRGSLTTEVHTPRNIDELPTPSAFAWQLSTERELEQQCEAVDVVVNLAHGLGTSRRAGSAMTTVELSSVVAVCDVSLSVRELERVKSAAGESIVAILERQMQAVPKLAAERPQPHSAASTATPALQGEEDVEESAVTVPASEQGMLAPSVNPSTSSSSRPPRAGAGERGQALRLEASAMSDFVDDLDKDLQ